MKRNALYCIASVYKRFCASQYPAIINVRYHITVNKSLFYLSSPRNVSGLKALTLFEEDLQMISTFKLKFNFSSIVTTTTPTKNTT